MIPADLSGHTLACAYKTSLPSIHIETAFLDSREDVFVFPIQLWDTEVGPSFSWPTPKELRDADPNTILLARYYPVFSGNYCPVDVSLIAAPSGCWLNTKKQRIACSLNTGQDRPSHHQTNDPSSSGWELEWTSQASGEPPERYIGPIRMPESSKSNHSYIHLFQLSNQRSYPCLCLKHLLVFQRKENGYDRSESTAPNETM